MNRSKMVVIAGVIALANVVGLADAAADGRFKARLSGFEEVPPVSSPGSGEADIRIRDGMIEYTLSYQDLETDVLFAHIHFGQPGVNGGVSVFLCSNMPAPVMTPACPVRGGSVSGTLSAADVVGPASQGIEPGEIDELIEAIESGTTYVNVHTMDFPAGELRGQLERGLRRD